MILRYSFSSFPVKLTGRMEAVVFSSEGALFSCQVFSFNFWYLSPNVGWSFLNVMLGIRKIKMNPALFFSFPEILCVCIVIVLP